VCLNSLSNKYYSIKKVILKLMVFVSNKYTFTFSKYLVKQFK